MSASVSLRVLFQCRPRCCQTTAAAVKLGRVTAIGHSWSLVSHLIVMWSLAGHSLVTLLLLASNFSHSLVTCRIHQTSSDSLHPGCGLAVYCSGGARELYIWREDWAVPQLRFYYFQYGTSKIRHEDFLRLFVRSYVRHAQGTPPGF